jgi:hypothetical protein
MEIAKKINEVDLDGNAIREELGKRFMNKLSTFKWNCERV